jgi:hypothetical protein
LNNITITISAPELVEAMQALTVALQAGQVKPAQVEQVIEKLEQEVKPAPKSKKADKPAEPTPEPAPETKPTASVSLDDVRIVLGNLSQSGRQDEVKQLISSFGVTKLSEIPTEKYAELLAAAEAI